MTPSAQRRPILKIAATMRQMMPRVIKGATSLTLVDQDRHISTHDRPNETPDSLCLERSTHYRFRMHTERAEAKRQSRSPSVAATARGRPLALLRASLRTLEWLTPPAGQTDLPKLDSFAKFSFDARLGAEASHSARGTQRGAVNLRTPSEKNSYPGRCQVSYVKCPSCGLRLSARSPRMTCPRCLLRRRGRFDLIPVAQIASQSAPPTPISVDHADLPTG
jgi:hypothetical protein